MAVISAHSPRTGTIEAFANAVGTGAEYVEFDIRRTADGELAAFHDARTRQGEPLAAISYSRLCEAAGYPVPRVADVMARIAGKATGHLDLKDTGGEEQVVEMALDILGAGNFVVTTLEDRSVAAIKARFPAVTAALSLGRDLDEVPRSRRAATRISELLPMRRLRACGIRTMVWTVDKDAEMRHWLTDGRVAVLITNRPADAVALRASLSPVTPAASREP